MTAISVPLLHVLLLLFALINKHQQVKSSLRVDNITTITLRPCNLIKSREEKLNLLLNFWVPSLSHPCTSYAPLQTCAGMFNFNHESLPRLSIDFTAKRGTNIKSRDSQIEWKMHFTLGMSGWQSGSLSDSLLLRCCCFPNCCCCCFCSCGQ